MRTRYEEGDYMTDKESLDDDSSKHDKSAANLNFSRFGSRKKEATPSDSRARDRTNFQDIHVSMVDKADEDQNIVQDINQRVQNKQQIKARTKFTNFSRPQQFTTPGRKGTSGAHRDPDGGGGI